MPSEECQFSIGVKAGQAQHYAMFQLAELLAAPHWRNGLSLAFPPSDVAALDGSVLTPGCIGLLGMAGALPYFYTEAVARSGSPGARAFMDLLSAPAIDLFCKAWRESRPEHTAMPALPLQRGPLRSRQLGERLAQALGVPVLVEQFAGCWQGLPEWQRSALGVNAQCGAGALVGARLWHIDHAVRIRVGPIERDAAQAFLPGREGALALQRLWRAAGGAGLLAEARIHLLPGAAEGARLGAAVRLGFDALLLTGPSRRRDDLRYRLC